MAEKPIIFSGPMVRAIIDGRKTMTRRIIKGLGDFPITEYDGMYMWRQGYRWGAVSDPKFPPGVRFAVGDRLWVRETCRAEELSRPEHQRPATKAERESLGRTTIVVLDELDGADGVRYVADDAWRIIENTPEAGEAWIELFHYRGRPKGRIGNLVPSIHMPRWASRITLAVTEVRVQRLQEIISSDAIDEGIESMSRDSLGRLHWGWKGDDGVHPLSPRDAFSRLWDSIHGPSAWGENPWVVAITFEREK